MTAPATSPADDPSRPIRPVRTLQNHVGGRWVASAACEAGDLIDPATGEVVARWPVGCAADVDHAVTTAAAAQPAWAARSLDERLARLERVADTVAEHAGELAELQCREMGKPTGLGAADRAVVHGAIAMAWTAADLAAGRAGP